MEEMGLTSKAQGGVKWWDLITSYGLHLTKRISKIVNLLLLTYMFQKEMPPSIYQIKLSLIQRKYLLLCGVSFFAVESTLASRTPLTNPFPSSVIN